MARILVIEDDQCVRDTVRDLLLDGGHVVAVASNGREGLAHYRQHHPEVVITDIFMPEGDGLEVILGLGPNTAIIAMSGGGNFDRGDRLADAIQFGACRALAKPFTADTLMTAVSEALTLATGT